MKNMMSSVALAQLAIEANEDRGSNSVRCSRLYIDVLPDRHQQIKARNLVISVYMKFPPLRGSFWKLSFNEQVLSYQPQRFSGCDVVTCVAQELTLGQATKTSLHVTDLISLGFLWTM